MIKVSLAACYKFTIPRLGYFCLIYVRYDITIRAQIVEIHAILKVLFNMCNFHLLNTVNNLSFEF